MKKLFPILAAILLLQGCSALPVKPSAPPPPPSAFTANVAVTYGEYEITAIFTQNSIGSYILKMLTPATLEPLAIAFEGGVCTVTYDDLKFETDLKRFPQTGFGALLIEVLEDIADNTEIGTSYSEGIWTYSGSNDSGSFILTQDNATGAWLALEIESAQLKIAFSDFTSK